jgi:hypothetical protein
MNVATTKAPNTSTRPVTVRFLQHTTANYVRDVYDALIELITNCDDAYDRRGKGSGGEIVIEHYARKRMPSTIVVRDMATGMTARRMKEISVFGRVTSQQSDRGFFGSGLKNCQALGDVVVESIVKGTYYRGMMSYHNRASIEITDERPATKRETKRLVGGGGNGTSVTIYLRDAVHLPRISSMRKELPYLYGLRKILDEKSNRKVFLVSGKSESKRKSRIRYTPPCGELVHDEEYKVMGHPCSFKLYKSDESLEDEPNSKTGKSGILVRSGKICHELTFFNSLNRNQSHSTRYFGELECDHIVDLLHTFDEYAPTKDNPVLVVQPERTGLNQRHPFAKKLYERPAKILAQFLGKDAKDGESSSIVSIETKVLFNQIEKCMGEYFGADPSEEEEGGSEKVEREIARRGIVVFPDHINVALERNRTVTVYVSKDSVKKSDKLKVSVDPKYATIRNVADLKNHILYDDRYQSSFVVEPKKITPNDCVIVNIEIGNLRTSAILEIVEKFIRSFKHNLEVGRRRQFTEGEHELRVYAHENIMGKNIKKPFKVKILSGSTTLLEPNKKGEAEGVVRMQPCSNYATGCVIIECSKIGSESEVEVQLGTYKAKTKIKTVAQKSGKTPFKIKLVEEETLRFRWRDEHTVEVSVLHPSIKPVVGRKPKYIGQNKPAGKMALTAALIEAVVRKAIQDKSAKGLFEFAGKTDENIVENISAEQDREHSRVSKRVFKVIK